MLDRDMTLLERCLVVADSLGVGEPSTKAVGELALA
jgi:hypothetical protein